MLGFGFESQCRSGYLYGVIGSTKELCLGEFSQLPFFMQKNQEFNLGFLIALEFFFVFQLLFFFVEKYY